MSDVISRKAGIHKRLTILEPRIGGDDKKKVSCNFFDHNIWYFIAYLYNYIMWF